MDLGIVSMQMTPMSALTISKWAVVGYWPCPKEGGWDTVYPPEENIDLSATYEVGEEGAKRTIEWQKKALPPGGGVACFQYFGQPSWACCYGVTYIWSPDDRDVGAFIAKDDALKIWVNGQLVFNNNTWSHYTADQHIATFPLKKGWNPVLVKNGNWDGYWCWALRVSDPGNDLRFTNETPTTP